MKKIGINTPLVGVEYQWEPKIKDSDADINFIKRVLDSFLISIDMGENISGEELNKFLKILRDYGHLSKFKDEYLEKYKKLLNLYQKMREEETKALSRLIGIWKGQFNAGGRNWQALLRIFEKNSEIFAEMDLTFQGQYHNSLTEFFNIKIVKDIIYLMGLETKFQQSGDTSEKEYNLDNFIFRLNEDATILTGKFIDVNNKEEIKLNKIQI